MVVGTCRITILVPESHSLKERRMVLRRIKDRVRNKFNVAIADVGLGEYKDSWQSAQIGFAVVSNELRFTQAMVQKVLDYIEALSVAKVMDDEQDFVQYGERLGGGGGGDEDFYAAMMRDERSAMDDGGVDATSGDGEPDERDDPEKE